MARLAMFAFVTLGVIASGDDAACPSSLSGVSEASGPSMVQMKAKRAVKQGTDKKLIPLIVHSKNKAGKIAGLAADSTGDGEVLLGGLNTEIIHVDEEKYLELKNNPNVDVVEDAENRGTLVHSYGEVFSLSQMKDIEETPWGITMVKAPLVQQGENIVRVCVVDTGYDTEHPDLPSTSNMANLSGYSPPVYGSNEKWYKDGNGHGTHCAGTIGAVGGNNEGVTSVNPDPSKFNFFIGKGLKDSGSGSGSAVIAAVGACIDNGATVISMSLGGGPWSQAEEDIFKDAYDEGILVIAAAGNDGNSDYGYPASFTGVMSVAAIDSNKNKASFSQWNDQVEIAAPGVNVKSTYPGGYSSLSGTSMACPHVAGVAALVWSNFPECKNYQIRNVLLRSALALGDSECDTDTGYGLVDALAAYEMLTTVGCTAGGPLLDKPSDSAFGGCAQRWEPASPTPAPPPPPTPAPCSETCDSRTFDLTFTPDEYPAENEWKLFDAEGMLVASNGALQDGVSERHHECLGSGAYTFTVTDTYGDGLCCSYGEGGWTVDVMGIFAFEGGAMDTKTISETINECTEQPSPAPEQPSPVPEQPSPVPEQPTPVPEQPSPVPEQPSPVPTYGPGPAGPPGLAGPPGPPGLAGLAGPSGPGR